MDQKLFLIHVNGQVEEITAERYGLLEYKCPKFSVMKELLKQADAQFDLIEHVSVLWQGERCHMFVDEMGLYKPYQINYKATRIYYNNTVARRRPDLVYKDLNEPAQGSAVELIYTARIVGPALLWTGGME